MCLIVCLRIVVATKSVRDWPPDSLRLFVNCSTYALSLLFPDRIEVRLLDFSVFICVELGTLPLMLFSKRIEKMKSAVTLLSAAVAYAQSTTTGSVYVQNGVFSFKPGVRDPAAVASGSYKVRWSSHNSCHFIRQCLYRLQRAPAGSGYCAPLLHRGLIALTQVMGRFWLPSSVMAF